jgi:hypothetical protein
MIRCLQALVGWNHLTPVFQLWLLSFGIRSLRLTHAVACARTSFLFKPEYYCAAGTGCTEHFTFHFEIVITPSINVPWPGLAGAAQW